MTTPDGPFFDPVAFADGPFFDPVAVSGIHALVGSYRAPTDQYTFALQGVQGQQALGSFDTAARQQALGPLDIAARQQQDAYNSAIGGRPAPIPPRWYRGVLTDDDIKSLRRRNEGRARYARDARPVARVPRLEDPLP